MEFLEVAARTMDVPLAWLVTGREFGRDDYDIVGAVTEEQRRDFDTRLETWFQPTETTRLLFQNAAARWIGDQGSYEERADKFVRLAHLVEAPIHDFGTWDELEKDGRRGETDYVIAMLHALMLAMPKRG